MRDRSDCQFMRLLMPPLMLPLPWILLLLGETACPTVSVADVTQSTSSDGTPLEENDQSLPADALLRLGDGDTALPSIRGVVYSPDGTLLATRGEPGDPSQPRTVHVWNAKTGKLIRTLTAHPVPLTSIRFSPDGRYLAAGQPQHGAGVHIWEVATGRVVAQLDGGRGRVHFLPETPANSGGRLAVVSAFGAQDVIRIHAVPSGKEVRRMVIDENYRFVLSPAGSKLVSIRSEGRAELVVADVPHTKPIHERPRLSGCQSQPTMFAFSADARTVAAGTSHRIARGKYQHRVLVWELATNDIVHELTLHTKRILTMAFSPDGRFLATGGLDRTVRVWELATGKLVHTFEGHTGPVSAVAFSPDGRTLASGSFDRTVMVWDAASRLRSRLPKTPPEMAELSKWWDQLAQGAPADAYRVMGRIDQHEAVAVPYLKDRVRSLLFPAESKHVQQLLAELDEEDSATRHRAMRELRKLRKIAKPLLLKTLKETTSAEVRYRLRRILNDTKGTKRFSTADVRRMLRIIHALERTPGDDARELLQMIIENFPEPAVTEEAKKTLRRIQERN